MSDLFRAARMGWLGTDLRDADPVLHARYRRHLDAAVLPALAASVPEGFAHRLERMPPRIPGPNDLMICEATRPEIVMPEDADQDWAVRRETVWRMDWRLLSKHGRPAIAPVRVRIIALSPPGDASAAEIASWNAFYTEIHVPEAMQRRGWTRATRWQLAGCERHPEPGCPRYMVLYEAARFEDRSDVEVAAWGPWSEGPPVWRGNVASWTLDYRIVAAAG